MPRYLKPLFVLAIALVMLGGPLLYYSHQRRAARNFRVVRAGVLYRSGQLSASVLKRKVYELGIKTVITLRDSEPPGGVPPDAAEEAYCHAQELYHYRITPRPWWACDGDAPAEQGVRLFRQVMNDPKHHPVLIHCMAGVHRTGAFCAVYRMEYEGWTCDRAVREMKELGYDRDDRDVLTYLANYRPTHRSDAAEAEEQ